MQLLVSVRDAREAAAALAGGADLIDAKDPAAGALGAVTAEAFAAIVAAVGGARPVTAAIGDGGDAHEVRRTAHAFADAGAAFVKLGFAGTADRALVAGLLRAARAGTASSGRTTTVVACAYADAGAVGAIPPALLIEVARDAGADGVLVDTADKRGPGLLGCAAPDVVAGWVEAAHAAGMFVALAGRLAPDDLPLLRPLGADVAGVRGAACEGGRGGTVRESRVRALRALLDHPSALAGQR